MGSPQRARRFAVTKNVGTLDRIVRIVAFVVIAVMILTKVLTGAAAVVLGIIAVALLITTLVAYCPLYPALKISTAKKKTQ